MKLEQRQTYFVPHVQFTCRYCGLDVVHGLEFVRMGEITLEERWATTHGPPPCQEFQRQAADDFMRNHGYYPPGQVPDER